MYPLSFQPEFESWIGVLPSLEGRPPLTPLAVRQLTDHALWKGGHDGVLAACNLHKEGTPKSDDKYIALDVPQATAVACLLDAAGVKPL